MKRFNRETNAARNIAQSSNLLQSKATKESFRLQQFSALGDISINISSVIRFATKTLRQNLRLVKIPSSSY